MNVLGRGLSVARGTALGLWSVGMTQTALLRMRGIAEPRRTQIMQRWVRRWARGLLALFGVDREMCGNAPRWGGGPRLVVANHRSPLDIIALLECFGGYVLARHDLDRWPMLGYAARESRTIFVDRNDPRSGVKAIREIRNRLRGGETVIVFPEGTTHAGDEVHPFQGGALAAARGLDGVELLPVGIAYEPGAEFVNESFGQHVLRVAQRRKTHVAICVGAPVPAGADREAMAQALRAEVQQLVHQARAALGRT
jgi:1-acyl-sn-glycerol-3-phosphate acyltransferase